VIAPEFARNVAAFNTAGRLAVGDPDRRPSATPAKDGPKDGPKDGSQVIGGGQQRGKNRDPENGPRSMPSLLAPPLVLDLPKPVPLARPISVTPILAINRWNPIRSKLSSPTAGGIFLSLRLVGDSTPHVA